MAWIESHTVLLRHRKVLQLANDLGLQPVHVIGHLHALWHTVLEQQEDGNLGEWPDVMIAQAAAYSGDAAAFVAALQSRKWLDGKIIHDWMDYAGRYLQVKYRTSNPARLLKIQKLHKSVPKSVSSRSKVCPKTDNLTLPNQPDLTSPNQTKPEELRLVPAVAVTSLVNGRKYREESKIVLAFLNEKSGKKFREVDATLGMIEARLKSGVEIQECKSLIARKVREWTTDPIMSKFIRPETLFNKTKFESYLAEVSS